MSREHAGAAAFARILLPFAAAALVLWAACRPLPPPDAESPSRSEPASERQTDADAVAAIADSIRRALRDSVDAFVRDSLTAAERRDSLAAASRRDSIAAAARDSIAAAARRDSIAAAARRDSILQAAQDSIAVAARRDSIAAAARRDSIQAAALEAARRDSIEDARTAARRDSLAAILERQIRDSIAAARRPVATVDELRELGPAYIPYDRGPQAVWDTETQAMLTTTLLPVVRAQGLTARTRAYYWLLLDEEGTVAEIILQTSSGNEAFDRAAREVAARLQFSPAVRAGRPVAAWIVRDISLVMQ